ncbi:MAG: hypothetical protein AAFN07_03665 [Pseudomonadota bacterium]
MKSRVSAVLLMVVSGSAFGVGTNAGTDILNTAQVNYELDGTAVSQSSNTVTITVDEVIDVAAVLQSPQLTVAPGQAGAVLVYTLTNTGNGPETFGLTVLNNDAADDFDPVAQSPAIFFDSDASGDLSAADTPYVPGDNDPLLPADATITVFVVNDIPAGLANGAVGRSTLRAESATGTGAPGTVFPGAGEGGADAVAGASGGEAEATGEYIVSDVQIAINKSAVVVDLFGGNSPTPGATINYTITVSVTGTGTATASTVADPIPASTTYQPGTLALNGGALTDADDADSGAFFATAPNGEVRVSLGDLVEAAGVQTITFSVQID